MKDEIPLVYVIILNWNGLNDTVECLNSLKRVEYDNFKIVVIDNGSRKEEAVYISKKFKSITVIKNERNLGYCKANNQGIELAMEKNADYILLLNNDTVVKSNFLNILVEYAEKYPDIGILNPKILYYKSNKIHSMGGKIFYLLGMFRNIGKGKNSENYKDVIDPEFATGCAMLIKREVIKKVGMLDPIYFAYCEDADFSLRAKRKGYKIRVIPSAIIFHKKSATSGFAGSDRLSNLQAYLKARNGIIFAKNLEEWKFLGYICGQFTFRLIYHLTVIKDFKSFISYMNGIYDGLEFLLQGKINEENLRKRF